MGKSEKPRYVKHVKPLVHTCRHVYRSRGFQHIWKEELFLESIHHYFISGIPDMPTSVISSNLRELENFASDLFER
jgi:hypothetical protein